MTGNDNDGLAAAAGMIPRIEKEYTQKELLECIRDLADTFRKNSSHPSLKKHADIIKLAREQE